MSPIVGSTIEILSPYPMGVVHRMKLEPLIQQKPADLNFCRIGEGNEQTVGLLVNGLSVDPENDPHLNSLLQKRVQHAVVMLFIPDIDSKLLPLLTKWSKFVDVFLVPTPEMKNVVEFFTERPVNVLFDPIDFGFTDSFAHHADHKGPLRIIWFGYPDSYQKSMGLHESTLFALHQNKEIEYHIVTRNNQYGEFPHCTIHPYAPETFPALLQSFDACVASHVPADFDINTYCKSENKAVLAINRGVPVIASKTPAYERLLSHCGLQEYLFSSSTQLPDLINKLRSHEERTRYLSLSQEWVLTHYTAPKMVLEWLEIYERAYHLKFKSQEK